MGVAVAKNGRLQFIGNSSPQITKGGLHDLCAALPKMKQLRLLNCKGSATWEIKKCVEIFLMPQQPQHILCKAKREKQNGSFDIFYLMT